MTSFLKYTLGGVLIVLASAVTAETRDTQSWQHTVIAESLDYPWDIDRSGERLFITEKAGFVVSINAAGELQRHRIETTETLRTDGGAGLLGLALAPDFDRSGTAYFYHSYQNADGPANKVIMAQFDGETWRETQTLLDGIPGHRLYNGGRIAIGPDQHLYITTGWTENWQRPQNLNSLAGKVLRMTLNGEVPADNPFTDSWVYSYGHRNPQGLAWNSAGELFVAEHGQAARDEINQVEAGHNYGWPEISGDETHDDMESPYLHSGSVTWAPSGIAIMDDTLLVAALRAQGLYALAEAPRRLVPAYDTDERYRQVLPVGDALYVITTNRSPRGEGPSNDRLIRIDTQ